MKFVRPDTGSYPYLQKNTQQKKQPKHVEKQSRIIQEVTNTSNITTYTDTDMTASLSIGSIFQVKWKFNTDDIIEMRFILNQKSWIGVGFGRGVKIIRMLIYQHNQLLNRIDTPPTDTQQDLDLISYCISDNSVKARIKGKLITGDPSLDVVLVKGYAYTWSYAASFVLVMEDHGHDFQEFSITLNETGDTVISYLELLMFVVIFNLIF